MKQEWWLVRTKVHPPPLRSDLIARPLLSGRLAQGVREHRLVLLSAPAGYGKTTLLRQTLPPMLPTAWLSLDAGEDDPTVFLTYLIGALQQLHPAYGRNVLRGWSHLPHSREHLHRLVGGLLRDVEVLFPDPFALVLDDLHCLTEPGVYAVLEALVEWMPPQMRVVIGTRHDPPLPLARLRGRGMMAEFRGDDLSFSREEADALLNGRLQLELSAAQVERLYRWTEGWATGLWLIASLLRPLEATARARLLANLEQTNRYVFDFLAEQVLDLQSEALRTFLLQTSILDELTVPLCNAVTGGEDAASHLAYLDRHNLFVTPLDESHGRLRYHPLFAEFLRRRLEESFPRKLPELHRRAAEALPPSGEALQHYLAAGLWREAAEMMGQVGEMWMERGMRETLRRALARFPKELWAEFPELPYFAARIHYARGEMEQVEVEARRALERFTRLGDKDGEGKALLLLADCALIAARPRQSRHWLARALLRPLSVHRQTQALLERVWWELLWGKLNRIPAILEEITALVHEDGREQALAVVLEYLSPLLALAPGGLAWMEGILHRATVRWGEEWSARRLYLEGMWGFVHLWRGRISAATRAGRLARLAHERLGGVPSLDVDVAATIALAWMLRRDFAKAEWWFESSSNPAIFAPLIERFRPGVTFLRGRMELARGHLQEAEALLETWEHPRRSALPYVAVLRPLMLAMIELARPVPERRLDAAAMWCEEALSAAPKARFTLLFADPRLLAARVALARGEKVRAMRRFLPFLIECERDRTPGRLLVESPFVQPLLALAIEEGRHAPYAARLLRLLEASHPLRVPATGEVLTRREVEVLRLLAAGAGNRLIAERLSISEHTVKSHIVHILRKLDVTSRTQAALQARALGLAPFPENQSFGG